MKKIFKSETALGLVLTGLVFFSYFQSGGVLETLELKFYDFRLALFRQPDNPAKDIAIITIDDDSITKLGRWPWPRARIAQLLETLSQEAAKPKVIGLNILFSEPEQNQGLIELARLRENYRTTLEMREQETKKQKPRFAKGDWGLRQSFKWWEESLDNDKKFLAAMDESHAALDNDAKLEVAISSAGNVVLPLFFQTGSNIEGKANDISTDVTKAAMIVDRSAQAPEGSLLSSFQATLPLKRFAQNSAGIGHVNTQPDIDGTVRREPLGIAYGEQVFPSFALEIVKHYLGLKSDDLTIAPGRSLLLGNTTIPLDTDGTFAVTFSPEYKNNRGTERSFATFSFYDVIQGKVAPEAFKNKLVLVGLTAAGLSNVYVTPVGHNFPGIDIVANIADNLFNKRFLVRPSWNFPAELAAILMVGLFVSLMLPRLKAGTGAGVSLGLLLAMLAAGTYLFKTGQWLKVTYPSFLLAVGYLVVFSKKFLVTERKKEQVEGESIETNKMLGLSFQGQGMLDLAFEKFRKCPVDDNMKELLYNLGLDFERKRQFNKAVAVYEFISGKDKGYKDVVQKIAALKKAADGAIMGGPIGKGRESTVVVEGAGVKPTLGRYEIEKELGKGAMGIVYLGRDPKINRQVAIKTMRFEEDMDEASMKAVKERFFREAQSAGNLSHPNIIKIFDAGEEQDVSYIAMELLEGDDLKKNANKANLLPLPKAVEYAMQVADALGYAHKQGVIHRDIKPANIMLLKDGSIRVTDFGIARIMASSQTATGTVLGTPSYMSPEQIAGKKVDGRSDLFSLGIVLFEMLTGEKPWKGGDSIGTLLFQIANDPPPDPKSIRQDLPEGLTTIIDKALKKNPDERYQTGTDMAADLRAFLEGKVNTPKPAAPAAAPAPPTATVAESKAQAAVAPPPAAAFKVTPAPMSPAPAPAQTPAPAPKPPATVQPALNSSATKPPDKTLIEPPPQNKTDFSITSKQEAPQEKTLLLPPENSKPAPASEKTAPIAPKPTPQAAPIAKKEEATIKLDAVPPPPNPVTGADGNKPPETKPDAPAAPGKESPQKKKFEDFEKTLPIISPPE
ncbi:MAG: CHASE2 domain-containing protein [Elusimicrobia bacterium]|nr:CHASE2 domain-containing protein [Elusimicrobiota bacterium]